ncbi:pentapeptide repeat-containing protein [Nonomuraea sp. B12E4]|uniref:pentapeptide repeat-containing protein n=1 Tax=Nonomuraea sp. B12E4 TaxID=3153564 RepID=UPI00325CCF2E
MTEFRRQDLSGARFERVSLRDAAFTRGLFNDARMHAADFPLDPHTLEKEQ